MCWHRLRKAPSIWKEHLQTLLNLLDQQLIQTELQDSMMIRVFLVSVLVTLGETLSASAKTDETQPDKTCALTDFQQSGFQSECVWTEDVDEPICVYSLTTFGNGRGISIATTPKAMVEILHHDAWELDLEMGSTLLENSTKVYEERLLPGRGRGLVATQALHRGESILHESSVLMVNPLVFNLTRHIRTELRWRTVNALPDDTIHSLWSLTTKPGMDDLYGRVNSNAFALELGRTSYSAVFPEVAVSRLEQLSSSRREIKSNRMIVASQSRL